MAIVKRRPPREVRFICSYQAQSNVLMFFCKQFAVVHCSSGSHAVCSLSFHPTSNALRYLLISKGNLALTALEV